MSRRKDRRGPRQARKHGPKKPHDRTAPHPHRAADEEEWIRRGGLPPSWQMAEEWAKQGLLDD